MFRSSGYLDISNYSSVPVQDQKQAPEKESIKTLFAREMNNRSSSLTDGSVVIKSDLPTLQARYVLLTAEIERVLSLNSALSQEVETYKNKLWKSERDFAEQTEDIKTENERLLKNKENEKKTYNTLSAQVNDLTKEKEILSSKCSFLSNEVDQIGIKVHEKNKEIKRLQEQLQKKSNMDSELKSLQLLMLDYERRNISLSKENEALNERVQKIDEYVLMIEALTNQIQELERFSSALKADNNELKVSSREKYDIEEKYLNLSKENETLHQQVKTANETMVKMEALTVQVQELENMMTALKIENNELNLSLREKSDIEEKYMKLSKENKLLNEELGTAKESITKMSTLITQIQELEQMIATLKIENSQLNLSLKEKSDVEERYLILSKENEKLKESVQNEEENNGKINRLTNQIQEMEQTITNLREINVQLNNSLREKANLEEKYFSVASMIKPYEETIQGNMDEIEELKAKVLKKESIVKDLHLSIESLQQLLDKTVQEKEDFEEENKKLLNVGEKNENYVKMISEYEKSLQELNEEISQEKRKYQELEVQRGEDVKQVKLETESLLKISFENEFKKREIVLEKEKAQYETIIACLKDDITNLEEKLNLLQKENEQFRSEVTTKSKEIEFLRENNDYNQEEIEELRKKITEKQQAFDTEKAEILKKLNEIQSKVTSQTIEITSLNTELQQKDSEIDQWKNKYMNLEENTPKYIEKTLAEIETKYKERLLKEKEEYSSSISIEKQQIEQKVTELNSKLKESELELSRLSASNHKLASRIEELNIKNENHNVKIVALLKEKEEQSQVLEKLQEERKLSLEKVNIEDEQKYKEQIEANEKQIQAQRAIIQDFELRQVLYFIEIERLYSVNAEFLDDLKSMSIEVQRLAKENATLNKKVLEAHQLVESFREEKDRSEAIVTELTGTISNNEQRIKLLLEENYRLSEHSVARLKEINELKVSYQRSLSTQEGSQSARGSDFQASNSLDFKEMITKLEIEKDNMEEQIKQFKNIINMHRNEIKRLEEINQHRKRENEWLNKEMSQLDGSARTVIQLRTELQLKNHLYEQCLKEVDELRKARNFMKQQLDQMPLKVRENSTEMFKKENVIRISTSK